MGSSIGDRLSSVGFGGNTGGSDIGRKIRRVLMLIVGLVVALVLLPTTITYVNPGYVGIVIHRAGGGVDKTPLGPGLHLRNPLTTGIEEYPVFMQTLVLAKAASEGSYSNEEINVNSKEGQPISLDVSMSFELDQDKAPGLYSTFRRDITTIQHGYVKQSIRQALQEVIGNEEIAAVIGPKKAEAVNQTQHVAVAAVGAVWIDRQAVHDQRAACAAGGDRGHQSEERDAAAGADGAERVAEEHVPGAGRFDQGGGSGEGHSLARGITGEGERSVESQRHRQPRAVRDGEEVGREDAAGLERRDPAAAARQAVAAGGRVRRRAESEGDGLSPPFVLAQ